MASRKDLKDAVVAARAAQSGWSQATAYNRGQILYRMAEMLEGRTEQFVSEISELTGVTVKKAHDEVEQSIDLLVWYAGWTDKISALDGATNPVAGPYYNFTIPEALGVVGFIAPKKSALLGFIAGIAPIIASGNTVIALASENAPLPAMSLAEVIATSDVPGGVVNILTGKTAELAPWFASHMDIDGLDITGLESKFVADIKIAGAQNLKRIHAFKDTATPGRILAFMESKTVWHPIGV
jgi:acyl-CoA reductase-like NAD-dependent aldehyde dehydrogenase